MKRQPRLSIARRSGLAVLLVGLLSTTLSPIARADDAPAVDAAAAATTVAAAPLPAIGDLPLVADFVTRTPVVSGRMETGATLSVTVGTWNPRGHLLLPVVP